MRETICAILVDEPFNVPPQQLRWITYTASNRVYWHERDGKGGIVRPEDASYTTSPRKIFEVAMRKAKVPEEKLESLWLARQAHMKQMQEAGAEPFDEAWAARWQETVREVLNG